MQKLEEAVTRLIDSPPLRNRLGAEAQAHVLREFSLERFITGMSSAYQAVLRGDKPSGEFAR
jgi:glycosyltransferase involved in cell wall biosynthesis